jgi:putative copper export protein
MSLPIFCDWLSNTPVSLWLQATDWVIPTLQSVHIVAIAMVMSSVLMLNLAFLGGARPLSDPFTVARRFSPWIWLCLLVLICTGSTLVVAEPRRELMNAVFVAKMALLLVAVVVTAIQLATLRRQDRTLPSGGFLAGPKAGAILSCVVWVGIVACGRWIAYAPHG